MKRLLINRGQVWRAVVASAVLWGSQHSGIQSAAAQIGGDLGVGRRGDLQMDRTQGGATGLITDRPRVPAKPPAAVPTPAAGPSPTELADEVTDPAVRANAQAGGNARANARASAHGRPNNRDGRTQSPDDRPGRSDASQGRQRGGDRSDRGQRDTDQRDGDRGGRDQRDRDHRDGDRGDRDQRGGDWWDRDQRSRGGWRDDWGEGGYSGRYDDWHNRNDFRDRRYRDNRWNDGRSSGSIGRLYNGRYYTNPIVGRLVGQFPGATRILAPRRYSVNGVFFRDRGTYYYYPDGSNSSAVPIRGVSSGSIPNGGSRGLVEIEFGGFQHMNELTQILPIGINDLCLDMYYNYAHNPRFMPVYRDAWQVLQISKDVRSAAEAGDRDAVRQGLRQADRLLHAVDRQTENWTRREQRQIGEMGIITKLQMVADLMHHTMYDTGIRLSDSHAQIQN